MWQYDGHATAFVAARAEHVLHPGIVATGARWHARDTAPIGIFGPDVLPPTFQGEGRIGDHAVKSGKTAFIEESGMAQRVVAHNMKVFDAVQEKIDAGDARGSEVFFLSIELSP